MNLYFNQAHLSHQYSQVYIIQIFMFKNNSYSLQGCNYSFRQEDGQDKENQEWKANSGKKDCIMTKLQNIEKMLNRQYQIEVQNKQTLKFQAQSINKIQKQILRLSKIIGHGNQQLKNSRMKSQSMKSCRNKRSTQKSMLHCLQERKKIITQQLSKRINDQLESRQEKRPLKFFLPAEKSIF